MLGMRKDQECLGKSKKFVIPAVARDNNDGFPIEHAFIISALAHPLVIALIWLIIQGILLLFALLGIHLMLFDKPKPKIRDLEFVLVNQQEQKPINPNTQNRADRNSRAGGKNNPNIPVSAPEQHAAKSTTQASSSSPAPRQSQPQRRPSQSKHMNQESPVPPRPMPYQNFSRPNLKAPNMFSMPAPRQKKLRSLSPNGGPVTSGPLGSYSPDSNPSPVMGGGHAGRRSRSMAYSDSEGGYGNPSPGNPNGAPGIDAIREPDWGYYVRDLERRIKRNWRPPSDHLSRRTTLEFLIKRDGSLLSCIIKTSSGSSLEDQAAISAVELSQPFLPLPPQCKQNTMPVDFTFDSINGQIRTRSY